MGALYCRGKMTGTIEDADNSSGRWSRTCAKCGRTIEDIRQLGMCISYKGKWYHAGCGLDVMWDDW